MKLEDAPLDKYWDCVKVDLLLSCNACHVEHKLCWGFLLHEDVNAAP